MFKQIKKLFIALVLVFSLCLVACGENCPECEECEKCPDGLIDPSECPKDKFDSSVECPADGYIKPSECPSTEVEGVIAPTAVEFYSDTVVVGKSTKFDVEVTPATAFSGVKWSSSDESIATVDEEGNVTGVRPGKVTITAVSVLDSKAVYSEEVEVEEDGLTDQEVAEREAEYLKELLDAAGYVSGNFTFPTTWNPGVEVVWTDVATSQEISEFVMPDLAAEGVTSKTVKIQAELTFGEGAASLTYVLKLVAESEGANDFERVAAVKEEIEHMLYPYLQGGEKVSSSIYLPETWYGVTLGWATSKAYVLTTKGVYTRPANDTDFTLTITPKSGAANDTVKFELVANGYTEEEKIAYLTNSAAKNEDTGVAGVLAAINGGKFAGSISLPAKDDKFGIKLTYVSSNPDVISDAGEITSKGVDTKVAITVTAVYEDANYPENAFVHVFDINVTAQNNGTTGISDIKNFAAEHDQLEHIPYGMVDNDGETVVLTKAEYDSFDKVEYDKDIFTLVKTSNDDTTGKLVLNAQYFRYHETNIKLTKGSAVYLWTINVGIGAVQDICYIGGRSQSYQASVNPTERGDMLQGFSYWDKYVGIVSNNNERGTQRYWSEFSGYTMYVDHETGEMNTVFTKDAEGNVTVKPLDTKETVRQQIFFMEFAVVHMDAVVRYADTDGDGYGDTEVYLPVVKEDKLETIRLYYGGNFGTLFVNESAYDLELPVSTLASDTIGGSYTDGEAMQTYTKNSIMLSKYSKGNAPTSGSDKGKDKVEEVKDDYGNTMKVSRGGNTWALDGYRPNFAIKPNTEGYIIKEGESKEYTFTAGTQAAADNPDNNGTYYFQYAITSDLSTLWGTPYVECKVGGFVMAFNSQTVYSFSKTGGYAIAGMGYEDVVVERYYRHPENEEVSDYIVKDINNYLANLAGVDTSLSSTDFEAALAQVAKDNYKAIKFEEISIDVLDEIEELHRRYGLLYDTWKTKTEVKNAGARLTAIENAAKDELAKLDVYSTLIVQRFEAIKTVMATFNNLPIADVTTGTGENAVTTAGIKTIINSEDLTAKVEAATRDYDSLTDGQKGLYDKGYEGNVFSFTAKYTSWIIPTLNFEKSVVNQAEAVTDVDTINGYVSTYAGIAKSVIVPEVKDKDGNVTTAKVLVEDFVGLVYNKTDKCLGAYQSFSTIGLKLTALTKAAALYGVAASSSKIDAAKKQYDDAPAAEQAIIEKTFEKVSYTQTNTDGTKSEVTGIPGFILERTAAAQKAYAEALVSNMAKTLELVKSMKVAIDSLPTPNVVKSSGLTTEQLTTLNELINKKNSSGKYISSYQTLISLYKTLSSDLTLEVEFPVAPTKPEVTDFDANAEKYDDLSDANKALYDAAMTVYETEKKAYDDSYTANVINVLVNGFKVKAEDWSETNDSWVKDTRVGYFGIYDDGKTLLENLNNIPGAYDEYKANQVIEIIGQINVNQVTLEDKSLIAEAWAAYNALSSAQQALANANTYVPALETLNKLNEKLESRRIEAIAKPITSAIDAIPTIVTLADKENIEYARDLWNATLNSYEQEDLDEITKQVTQNNIDKIKTSEQQLLSALKKTAEESDAYKEAVKAFTNNKLDGTVTKSTKAELEALLAAYNAMNETEKEWFNRSKDNSAALADISEYGADKAIYNSETEGFSILVSKISSALKVYNKYVAE